MPQAFAVSETIDIYSKAENSIYQIRVIHQQTGEKSSIGSGFVVLRPDIIATNYHVVSGFVNDPDTYVLDYLSRDGRTGSLELLDLDITHDLAVLKVDRSLGVPMEIAPVPEKGAHLFSLGNPRDLGFSIVEGTNNGIMENTEERNIHVSGSLNPGMSGGPTVNDEGKVIGINVATAGNEISFLVSAEHLQVILDRVKKRDYEPVDDIFETISEQLRENAKNNVTRLLEDDWGETSIGKMVVPSKLKKTYRCWDASPAFKKEVMYSQISANCSNEYNLFISSVLDVGSIAYEYHWLETEEMFPARFYRSYEDMNSSNPPGNAGAEDVTNFACHTDFIRLAGQDFKATICRRDYLKYTGLSDVLITIAMVGHKKEGFIFNLDLVGTDFESSMELLKHMLEKFSWQD